MLAALSELSTIFAINSILDIWQRFEYAFVFTGIRDPAPLIVPLNEASA